MPYRVIQWSTGNVGRFALRCIIGHPELELVGVWASSAAKAGKDAGELCGVGPVGVKATADADALLRLDADCVCYTATRIVKAIPVVCGARPGLLSALDLPLVTGRGLRSSGRARTLAPP